MPLKQVGRYIKRQAKSAAGKIKRRYWDKKGLNVGNITRDLTFLKTVVNAEKKRFNITGYNQAVGQLTNNASGHFILDVTPNATEGVGYAQRTGASLKMCSSYYKFQFLHQANTTRPLKGKIYLYHVKGVPQSTSSAINFLTYNTWIYAANGGALVFDYDSDKNVDFYGEFKQFAVKKFTVPCDNITSQPQNKTFNFGIKMGKTGHHVRFAKDTTTVVDGQIMMLIVLEGGNCATSAGPSTYTAVTDTAITTGLTLNYDITHYYYDN